MLKVFPRCCNLTSPLSPPPLAWVALFHWTLHPKHQIFSCASGCRRTPEREPAFKEIIPYRGDNSLMHSNRSFARQQSDLEKVVSSALVSLRRRSLDQKEKKKKGIIWWARDRNGDFRPLQGRDCALPGSTPSISDACTMLKKGSAGPCPAFQWLSPHLPVQRVRVQSLAREPRSHMLGSQKTKTEAIL